MFESIEEEEKEPDEQKPTRLTGFFIAVATLPILLFFTHIGKTDLGLNVGICLSVNVLAIRMRWDLRRYYWFWVTMVLVLALEVPLVLMIKWPHKWVPAVELLPIGLAGYLIAIGAIRFVERFVVKYVPPDEEK
jgi:hypothetical protein